MNDTPIELHLYADQAAASVIMARFESLGGAGHGSEFALIQAHFGVSPDGLLAWADWGHDLLVQALEAGLVGVGAPENTIVFLPEGGDECWVRDTRFWMASRTFVSPRETDAQALILARRQSQLAALRSVVAGGEKILVFRNLHHNLDTTALYRLHQALRHIGRATLLYVQHADGDHVPGSVDVVAPGLMVGYLRHFVASRSNEILEVPFDDWLSLCRRAAALVGTVEDPPRPQAAPRIAPDAGRRIALIGNCQMEAMAGLYRRFVAGRSRDVITHIPSYEDLSDQHRRAIEQSDLVVEQLFDLKQHAETEGVSSGAPRIFVPMVTAAFLWPFAGSPHPKNAGGGPYVAEASDSYLNRLIQKGTDPEEAVEAYLALDVNTRVNLDRLYELVMDRQRARDAAAGFEIAGLMERHFRDEQIFLSPYHPNVRIAVALASQLFARLGASREEIERMRDCTRVTPFPKTELPMHPSVCRHFALTFVAPDRRYRFMNEGRFTLREYALRYMRYEWNEAIEGGIQHAQAGRLDEARDRLTEAVARSPDAAAAHNALGHVLERQGASAQALQSVRRAVALEPDSAAYRASLGNLLRHTGDLDGAVAELSTAVAADPTEPHYRMLIAHALRDSGRAGDACAQAREAARLDPYSAKLRAELAGFMEGAGDFAGAIEALRDALALDPEAAGLLRRLANALASAERIQEATAMARDAVAADPGSAEARAFLSGLLLRAGNGSAALSEAYAGTLAEPGSAAAYAHLGTVLRATGDAGAAEIAFRRAAQLDPGDAHLRHELSVTLAQLGRFVEAAKAAREAFALQPGNAHRREHLAVMEQQSGDAVASASAQ